MWKKQLRQLEKVQEWDWAIHLMQKVIVSNPDDVDAALAFSYLLMNLLTEEEYDLSRWQHYTELLQDFFDESYATFSHNPEYLFYMAKIAHMSVWYFDLEVKDALVMAATALNLEPDNILYQDHYYTHLDITTTKNKKKAVDRVHMILDPNSPVKKILQTKGALGKYIFGINVFESYSIIHGTSISDEAYDSYLYDFEDAV